MKGIIVAVTVSVLLFFVSTEAGAQARRAQQCEACSLQQMRSAASASARIGQKVYVFSLSTGVIRHYLVQDAGIMPMDTPASLRSVAVPIGLEPAMVDYFQALVELYDLNDSSLEISYKLYSNSNTPSQNKSGDLPQSAYEVINNSAKRNALMESIHSTFPSLVAGFNSVIQYHQSARLA